MHEIVISNPSLNTEGFVRRFSYNNKMREAMGESLRIKGITPKNHPKAADLCAGDGSFTRILVDNGWIGSNITCVDKYTTTTPLVPDAVWKYWDLEQMAVNLRNRQRLPDEIAIIHHSFDIAFLWLGGLSRKDSLLLCRYFVRPEGYIWC